VRGLASIKGGEMQFYETDLFPVTEPTKESKKHKQLRRLAENVICCMEFKTQFVILNKSKGMTWKQVAEFSGLTIMEARTVYQDAIKKIQVIVESAEVIYAGK
jgi:hypothetical protein